MKIAIATLKSNGPYSQSKKLPAKPPKEDHQEYEARIWRERLHVNDDGFVFIPPMAFKFSIETAASFLRMRIPGKGTGEFGKHFKAGVLVPHALVLPVKKDDVQGEWLSLHANGKRGSGTRVDRCMPVIREWSGQVAYYVLDDTITTEVFEYHLREAGNFIGIGRFRPQNGGFYGRYLVESVEWKQVGM